MLINHTSCAHGCRRFDNILERRIEWPDDMSPLCRDLIDRLLCSDPGQRLGARGAGEVPPHALTHYWHLSHECYLTSGYPIAT